MQPIVVPHHVYVPYKEHEYIEKIVEIVQPIAPTPEVEYVVEEKEISYHGTLSRELLLKVWKLVVVKDERGAVRVNAQGREYI